MNTIPQRLREIAVRIGTHDMSAYVQLRAIASELEAPASDDVQARGIQEWADSPACAGKLLVLHRDHIATVSALQARIKDLETQLKTRSQKLREAGYTRRPSAKTLPPDE